MKNTKKEAVLQGYRALEDIKQGFLDEYKQNDVLYQRNVMDIMEHLVVTDTDFGDLFQWFSDNDIEVKSEDDDADLMNDDTLVTTEDDDDIDFLDDDTDEEDMLAVDIESLEQSFANSSHTKTNNPAKMYLKEIGRIGLLDPKKEPEITRQTQADDEEVRKKLVSANLCLVALIMKKYVSRGMLSLDLTQKESIGLVKAAEKLDYAKGSKFSTHATWQIHQAITCAIVDQARTIRISVHMVETINKLTCIQRRLVQDLGKNPSIGEIAARMGNIPPERIRKIQKIVLGPVSLEASIGEGDDSHLGNFIKDREALLLDKYVNNQLPKDKINTVLQGLTKHGEKVLRLRFGLYDDRAHTLEEAGKEFNVTHRRIRQIEVKALHKLKHPTRFKRLEDFVDKP